MKLIARGVALGLSLVWEMDRRALQRGTSRSIEVARYVGLALDARASGVARRSDHYLDDTSRGPGRATVWAAPSVWVQVDATAGRLGMSASEAVRALVHAGLAVAAPEPDVATPEAFRARALGILAEPRTAQEFARAMWPAAKDGFALRNCARRVLLSLDDAGLVDRHARAWKRPARWAARPA